MAVFFQVATIGYFVGVAYAYRRAISPSFFAGAPWRLRLWASLGAYMSLALLVVSCTDLFLPRAPAAVQRRFAWIGVCAVGVGALNAMVTAVLAVGVEDRRVLMGCTGGVAACIAGLLVFWAWLARKYGGGSDPSENGKPCTARLPGLASSMTFAFAFHVWI
ncbi:hypothetical protein GQ55_4G354600 [Panicum hallii var. hallii]|uniref:DUF7378 domain-containing protein n=1 Tax=Panicum hallii var. hallii TaxID=1504633 RepID=A0A2T7E3H3_9POAL|nr:hypothetical protein GQ55_4G354600 [Panicum hallii var. hallii]